MRVTIIFITLLVSLFSSNALAECWRVDDQYVCVAGSDQWLVDSFDDHFEAQNTLIAYQASLGDPSLVMLIPARLENETRYLVIYRAFVDLVQPDPSFELSVFKNPEDAAAYIRSWYRVAPLARRGIRRPTGRQVGVVSTPDSLYLVWTPRRN